MNYIKLYIGDYLKKTGALSVAEHGAYMLMLLSYYATEEPLPKGRELYRLIRAETRQERDAVDSVASRFWEETEDGLRHGRADEEIEKAAKARAQHALAGTKGGRPRKQTETNLVFETKANEKPTNTITNKPPPSLRSGAPPSSRKTPMPVDFEVSPRVAAWAEDHGFDRLEEHLGVFRRKAAANGYRYADWDSAFMEAIREDWAKLRTGNENSRRDRQEVTRKSAVDRVREANREALEGSGDAVASHDGDLRPQVDERPRRDAHGAVVDGAFRVVG